MGEVMTVAEIKAMFKDEWVVIGNPEPFLDEEPVRGILLSHGKDRGKVCRDAKASGLHRYEVIYTGPVLPPGLMAAL